MFKARLGIEIALVAILFSLRPYDKNDQPDHSN